MLRLIPIVVVFASIPLRAQAAAAPPRNATSAPIADVRYDVTFNRETAGDRLAHVTMSFTASTAGSDPVLLSLPAWTPGAYEISNFARWVLNFAVTQDGRALTWDKMDYDTWRIPRARGAAPAGPIVVSFDYRADSLDNAMAWARPDFLLFNGTNFFLYPEGQPAAFASRVTVHTESDWHVATAMPRAAGAASGAETFSASTYHELVDMPFFVGDFDVDSSVIAGKWMRFATYPAGAVQGRARDLVWDQLRRTVPVEVAVFGETPWDSYTIMQIVDSAYQGASGLEHASSHVDVLAPAYIGSDFQPSLYAHEIFHAWNVKRLRPADMWPYRYDAPMPTTWLWMSEGVTDYYADLALVRGGVVADTSFYQLTAGKIDETNAAGAVALEDASLSTWVHPTDGTQYIYYPKGSLAGLMLDIMIRDATDNARSLDDAMRDLYATTYKQGRGFTHDEFWNAVSRAAGGVSFADFERKYIDGREPYPWTELLPRAGLRITTLQIPRLGIATAQDAPGGALRVTDVDPAAGAAAAGVRAGDHLLAINGVSLSDDDFGTKFRAMFATARNGQPIAIQVSRGDQTLTLTAAIQLVPAGASITADPAAGPKAARIRDGLLRGVTGR